MDVTFPISNNTREILSIIKDTIPLIEDYQMGKLLEIVCTIDYSKQKLNTLRGYTLLTNKGYIDVYFIKTAIYQPNEWYSSEIANLHASYNDKDVDILEIDADNFKVVFSINGNTAYLKCVSEL